MISDAELDALRLRADPILDPLLAAFQADEVPKLLGALFATPGMPDDARFERLLRALPRPPVERPEVVEAGQAVFQLFGPEALLVLGCYGLPVAYAAAHGVQVIHRARRLQDDARRRLCETAQMALNVMQPGAFAPDGVGTRSALKVRLMHACVRRHVRDLAWSVRFGEPINQEDLAGTLLTFSLVVLDGLRKIGAELTSDEQRAYLWAWRHVGLLLGIEPQLAPTEVAEARQLAETIARRQFRACDEGRALTRQLVPIVDGLFPLPGYGASLMHFFLDDTVFGLNLAEILDLPPSNWTRALVRARSVHKRHVLHWLNRVAGARHRRRVFARYFAQRLILLQNRGRDMPFEVAPGLLRRWGLRGQSS